MKILLKFCSEQNVFSEFCSSRILGGAGFVKFFFLDVVAGLPQRKFGNLENLENWKIWKIGKLENSENLENLENWKIGKFSRFSNFPNFPDVKLENWKIQKIWKIGKLENSENRENWKIGKFSRFSNFPKFPDVMTNFPCGRQSCLTPVSDRRIAPGDTQVPSGVPPGPSIGASRRQNAFCQVGPEK